jgi:hypothetical protein
MADRGVLRIETFPKLGEELLNFGKVVLFNNSQREIMKV